MSPLETCGPGPEGLETVHHAYERLRAEQTVRQAPRDEYQRVRSELDGLRRERERLDKPWRPYEYGPLDQVGIARSNAKADVNQLTGRHERAGWRDRRSVGRQLDDATGRLDQAETAYQDRYRHERDWLDPLIVAGQERLGRIPVEPHGERDRQIDKQLAWLRWEITAGNRDRPTRNALRALAGVVTELDRRNVQYQRHVEAERAAAARHTIVSRQWGPEPPERGRGGPELGP